jgi:hypothetical protein
MYVDVNVDCKKINAYIRKTNIVPDLQCLKNICLDNKRTIKIKKSIIRTLISEYKIYPDIECFNNYMIACEDEEMIELYNFSHKK